MQSTDKSIPTELTPNKIMCHFFQGKGTKSTSSYGALGSRKPQISRILVLSNLWTVGMVVQ